MTQLSLGATIGILGDGQLGRMLAQAASRLGFKVCIFGPERYSPAGQVSFDQVVANFNDFDALTSFSQFCDVITFEWENIPVETLEYLIGLGANVTPNPKALSITQDRLSEKLFARSNSIQTAEFAKVESVGDLTLALKSLGYPSILKTRREGYDGKGQTWLKSEEDITEALNLIGNKPAILEAKASFIDEISVVAVRSYDGAIRVFPIGINYHKNGILDKTIAPAILSEEIIDSANDIAHKVLNGLDYVGVLAVELFVMQDRTLWLNEIAPRVHNSGHWTQDGCVCDQFEQHIRAIVGWPLGDVTAVVQVEMTNLLGDEILAYTKLASEPMTRLHFYGKDAPRVGRKMGHINRLIPINDQI